MANEAHKEPTMEEILASIRKIIADDTPAEAKSAAPRPQLREAANTGARPDFGAESDLGMFDIDEPDEPVSAGETIEGPDFSFEEMLGSAKADAAPAEPPPAPEPARPVTSAARRSPPAVETAMPANPRYAEGPLTDSQTAESAAGALGKLISKMDLGSDNTIEGLVRELLKPMIKEWLDANLAAIVEEKVEAEVQRIARMAR